jgi:metal-responsive CopG/Arc/MetJ family transcriptional regulator
MRSIIDIPEEINVELNLQAKSAGISRAELVRRAITAYLSNTPKAPNIEAAFGLWKKQKTMARSPKMIDGLDYQNQLRSEWE